MNGTVLIAAFQTPLSTESMLKYDFFDLYPNDGGGGFIMRKELPVAGDRAVTEIITQHNGLSVYGTLPELDYHIFDDWINIERCSWINRLYFLVPLARVARLDNDQKLARLVVETMLYFKRTQRPPASIEAVLLLDKEITRRRNEEYNEGKGSNGQPVPYQWYDFQPAARVIHFIHSLVFLRDLKCISDSEADELADSIFEHTQVIFRQESVASLRRGNHQALRGLALLYGGCFYGNSEFIELGKKIINFHIRNDFAGDGLLLEASPTYHCFETWISRDACYLAEKYGFSLENEAVNQFKKTARAARMVCRPDNKATLLNDGCNFDMQAFITTLPEDDTLKNEEYSFLECNNIAVWRPENWYMLMDMSHFTGKFSHYHAGKNAINLWYKKRPFITDSGCCDYDAPEFKGFFKNAEAHASLLVDGTGDGTVQGTYNWLQYAELQVSAWNNGTVSGVLTSTDPNWKNVSWNRKVHAAGDCIDIMDEITSDKEHRYEFIFPLAPECKAEITGKRVHIENHGEVLSVEFSSDELLTIGLRPSLWCDDFEIRNSRAIRVMLIAQNGSLKSRITPGK